MWRRNRSWPRIDLYRRGGSGVIKVLSREDLQRLMADATDRGWSANGRPDWLRQHVGEFDAAYLVVFGPEGAALWRCIVTVILAGGEGGRFTLDVSASGLSTLPDMDSKTVVVPAHRYLATFPPIDLDADQAATWDESVWRKWGEGSSPPEEHGPQR